MEIERKFLLHSIPDVKTTNHAISHQGYYLLDPELRFRDKTYMNREYTSPIKDTRYFCTVKSVSSSCVRDEVEGRISKEFYDLMVGRIEKDFITKHMCTISTEDGFDIDISIVDKGSDASFIYAEVEFETIKEMETFVWPYPDNLIKEVSGDPYYAMQNYWKRTRLRVTTQIVR